MTVKHKVTVSIDPPPRRPNATQRRAALTAAIAGQQQNLKREAAERRAKRARDDTQRGQAEATSIPRSQRMQLSSEQARLASPTCDGAGSALHRVSEQRASYSALGPPLLR